MDGMINISSNVANASTLTATDESFELSNASVSSSFDSSPITIGGGDGGNTSSLLDTMTTTKTAATTATIDDNSHSTSMIHDDRSSPDDDDATTQINFIRLNELERKLSEQSDEIVCLKSTLADVLRRLNQLEGRAMVTTSYHHHQQHQHQPQPQLHHHQMSSPNLQQFNGKFVVNNGHSPTNRMVKMYGRNLSSLTINGNMTNCSTPQPQQMILNNNHQYPQSNSLIHNRRFQSSTSLHQYDHPNHHHNSPAASSSSSSVSSSTASSVTAKTPSSKNSNHLLHNRSISSMMNNSANRTLGSRINSSSSNLKQMKRWSASQDIRFTSIDPNINSAAVRDFYFNQVDGTIKFNILNRQITLNIPTDLLQTYSITNQITNPPSKRLKLEWVYGYRGRDCRHNLYQLPTGEIVYFIAAIVVLDNIDEKIQRHYTGHTNEIRCLTIHPNKLLIATGQAMSFDGSFDKRPHVRIWDSVSLNTLYTIGLSSGIGDFDRGISCLSFSKYDGGQQLCIVDDSNDHLISIWDWQKQQKLMETKSTCDPILVAEYHPIEKNMLITFGRGHIFFWDLDGGTFVKKIGSFEKCEKPKYVLCMTFNDLGELLTGDSNGNVIVWNQITGKILRIIQGAHEGSIFDICTLKDGTIVTGGGKDRKIIEWNSTMMRTGREAKLPEQYGGVRTLTTGKGSMLIVGTTKNCILQGTMSLNFSLVVQGHYEELNAMAIHPTQNQFITGGYDHHLHLWDTMAHSIVWSKDIGEPVQAAEFSPEGNVIIVSTTHNGKWIVIDATTRQSLSIHNDGNERIDCIKFSTNGRYLAFGSIDSNVYVYQIGDDYRKFNRIGRCSGHKFPIISIDWDTSNTYIQTVSKTYEHHYWNATICRQLNNTSISRDLEFNTYNSMIGFHVFGIWSSLFDENNYLNFDLNQLMISHHHHHHHNQPLQQQQQPQPQINNSLITTVDRSHNQKLLITGDHNGCLHLFSYPSTQPKSMNHSYKGHCPGRLPMVRFLPDDSRIISIGGKDSSILQWSVL